MTLSKKYQSELFFLILIVAILGFFSAPATAYADTTFASDTFTDTNAVLLENHLPDVGTSWTKGSGSTGALTINSNTIYSALSGNNLRIWYIGATSATADYDVQATFSKNASGGATPVVIGRASTSAVTAYAVRCDAGGWSLYKWVSGTNTTLGSYAGDACTTARVGRLRMRGNQISVYIDDVLRIGPITDSSISAAGRAGVGTYYADSFTDRYLDTWSALNDTTAPTYSAVASSTTSVSATVTWTSDEPGTSQVEYGLTTGYGSFSTLNTTSTTTHSVSLSGLSSATIYNYRVATVDGSGNIASSTNYTLLTAPTDSTPPVRSAGAPSGTLAAGTTAVTLSLTTNEGATCKYGTVASTAYASIANTFTTTGGTSHSQSLTGLTVGSYTYYVRCQDEVPNPNIDDYSIAFTIPADTTAPSVPTNLTATATTTSQIGLSWTASTDNVAVTGYSIYRSGLPLASTSATTYYDLGRIPATLYSYTVSAYDATANDSGVTAPATATTNATTTYYISPTTGSDSANGLTTDTPWKTFNKAFTTMSAADELVLLDGTYSVAAGTGYISDTGTNSGQIPSGISTTSMTYVHAQNPGSVTINGGLKIGTITQKHSYIKIEGITFDGGTTASGANLYNTSNIYIKNSSFHSESQSVGAVFNIGTNDGAAIVNSDILVEDSWVWGKERQALIVYRAEKVIIRRVVTRNDGCYSSVLGCGNNVGNQIAGTVIYNSNRVSFQNVIAVDNINGPNGYAGGADFYIAYHNNFVYPWYQNEWLGTISLNSGLNAGYGYDMDNLAMTASPMATYQNIVAWNTTSPWLATMNCGTCESHTLVVSNATLKGSSGSGFYINNNMGNSVIAPKNMIVLGTGGASTFGVNSGKQTSYVDVFGTWAGGNYNGTSAGTGSLTTDPTANGSLLYITRIESGSPLKGAGEGGADIGANVIYKYGTNGTFYEDAGYNTLTGNALWPWPNEAQIKSDMCATITGGWCDTSKTLTQYIWEYLGNSIPAGIYTAPTLTTQSASSLAQTTATLNGNITATGDASVTVRGFAYGTDSTLSTVIATTTASGSFSTGAFTGGISSLTCNTTYYARAYATNSGGTGLGPISSAFTTSACAVAPASTPGAISPIITGTHQPDSLLNITTTSSLADSGLRSASGLSPTQIQSILSFLSSFGVDAPLIASVERILLGTPSKSAADGVSHGASPTSFTRNLQLHMTGTDVRALQQYLNATGFIVAFTGPGSPGNETTTFGMATYRALVKFQRANNLAATGFFGPLTRGVVGSL